MTFARTLRAPAKINLTLEVLDAPQGGLHKLRSVMVPIGIYDEIGITSHGESAGFTTSHPQLANENLVVRALRLLDVDLNSLAIHLHKGIPVAAGLGGGSSDAATILIAASNGFFGNRSDRDFLALANALGSDVTFFLTQTGALVEGSGERATAIGALPSWWSVVIHPPLAVSTAMAYAELDRARAGRRKRPPRRDSASLRVVSALQAADLSTVQHLLANDFQSIIAECHASVRDAIAALRLAGAINPTLTGTGSCVFALAQTENEARTLASRLHLPPGFHTYVAAFDDSRVWAGGPQTR
ncbi:MAG: 4-(cytidine 5'-diphospho)-2-C-methyl-D-erythritol kinase [Candidatus Eremiobacteraeota bacterium]|nr:4-(cytidine 5'-diphospho)-2-C-methyl-D-erythritol kinase [Candidatus Eremiobacteraeota bacterium]